MDTKQTTEQPSENDAVEPAEHPSAQTAIVKFLERWVPKAPPLFPITETKSVLSPTPEIGLIREGILKTHERIQTSTIWDEKTKKVLMHELYNGFLARTKILGVESVCTSKVSSQATLDIFLSYLTEMFSCSEHPCNRDVLVYRFKVPMDSFRAYNRWVAMAELPYRNDMQGDGLMMEFDRSTGRMHPRYLFARSQLTNVVSFHLNTKNGLLRWHAGEDVRLWDSSTDRDTWWIKCIPYDEAHKHAYLIDLKQQQIERIAHICRINRQRLQRRNTPPVRAVVPTLPQTVSSG